MKDGMTEAEFVAMREGRDAKLAPPLLLLPSIQVNMRAGRFPGRGEWRALHAHPSDDEGRAARRQYPAASRSRRRAMITDSMAAEGTVDFVTGPCRFEVLPDVGHYATDQMSDRVNALLLEQLARHRP
ncbi:hypothetical protein ACFQU2_13615 [Siccirubricoccus deserti]